MNRIKEKFEQLREQNKKALITFATAADPNFEVSKKLIKQMETDGADIIEIGVPYSDPVAEGPIIQAANQRALKNKVKIADVMEMVRELREEYNVKVPFLYILYLNCILQYGVDKFFKHCKKVGVDGIIVPDLPFEEQAEISEQAEKYDIDIITLVAPTSKDRIEKIARNAKGFLYCVTSLGVTGVRSNFETNFDEFFSYINKYSKVPNVLGFGISTPEHIEKLKVYADGLIVASAIVEKIEKSKSEDEMLSKVSCFVKQLRMALDK